MNFSRKTIFVVGAALLAACGDKVTVQEYTPPTPTAKVNFVEVTPATATLNIGDKITLTAAVNADAGLATTVTWSSSDATKASVSTAGLVEAKAATPGVAICAASTVDAGKKGCATIIVSQATQVIPASISINSITLTGALGGATANPLNIVGGIDVTLNVNPGNQTISKVELLIGGKVAGTQSFSAAQSAALRYAADEAVAAQTTFPQIVFAVNTAAFDAATGIPTWYNGAQTLQAKVYSAATATASVSQNLTFNNPNTYVLTSSTSGTPVTGTNGYKYSTGNISTSIIPVIYNSGQAFAAGTITFGAAGCDAFGPRRMTLAAGTAPAYTATFTTTTGAASATDFDSYELRTAVVACPLATGEGFTVTATDNAGNQLFAAAAPANNTANLYRMDNVAPGAPTLMQNPGGRTNGWVNGTIGFTTAYNVATAPDGMVVDGTADAGVGGRTRLVRVAATTDGSVDAAIASAPVSTLPNPSATNSTYCAVFSAKDALGNESTLPAAGTPCSPVAVGLTALAATHTLLGIDIAAPQIANDDEATITAATSFASNARSTAASIDLIAGGQYRVLVNDTGTVGNSGMNALTPGFIAVSRRNVAGTVNLDGTGAAAANSTPAVTGVTVALPNLSSTFGAGTVTTTGYYTATWTAMDAAGNKTSTVTRVVALDPAANVPALTTASYTSPIVGGSTVAFLATASDNFDLRDLSYNLNFAAMTAGAGVFPQPTVVVGTYNENPLVTSILANLTISGFIRQIEEFNAPAAVAGVRLPASVTGTVRDAAGNVSPVATTPLVVTAASPAFSYLASGLTSYTISAPAAAQNVYNGTAGGPTVAGTPSTRTITISLVGPTAVFNNPFTSMKLYRTTASGMVLVGEATYSALNDNGVTRTFTWTATFDGTGIAAGAQNLFALGCNATGDCALTQANVNLTVIN